MNIGSVRLQNNVVLAPMAGITNLPFRLLARQFGCALAYTEMISVSGLVRESDKTFRYLATTTEDKPLGVQIFGADPDLCSEAAKIAAGCGADLIDINMGCPVRKVVKTGAGAALMLDVDRIGLILDKVRRAVSLPLTAKIRSGWHKDRINAVEVARRAEACGCDAITVHGRTARQGYGVKADWSIIADVKAAVGIPVIGNGDVNCAQDAIRMKEQTGCDGVMVGRGALGNPMIFAAISALMAGQPPPRALSAVEREELIKRHLELEIEYAGERSGVRTFRKHLLWYTKGLKGGASLRNSLASLSEKNTMLSVLHDFLSLQR